MEQTTGGFAMNDARALRGDAFGALDTSRHSAF
jgi:hypothetical protein